MSEPPKPAPDPPPPMNAVPQPISRTGPSSSCPSPGGETMVCERCGADMFRMHAVWRCPQCRYKTDCCGW